MQLLFSVDAFVLPLTHPFPLSAHSRTYHSKQTSGLKTPSHPLRGASPNPSSVVVCQAKELPSYQIYN